MPRQSINTHASHWRAKKRTERRSSPAIWSETFPAAPLTFDSFSNLKATRSRRRKSFRKRRTERGKECAELVPRQAESILSGELRFVMGEPFTSSGEVFVERCEVIFQRLVKILTLTRPSATLSHPAGEGFRAVWFSPGSRA